MGRSPHEAPSVPIFGASGGGLRLREGMALAIELLVNAGEHALKTLDDRWTVMAEGSLSAHVERTVIITRRGAEILTLPSH